jgi:hypothetical protein
VPGPRDGNAYRVVESCAASLKRTAIDGTVTALSAYLVEVGGQAQGPTDYISAYRVKLKVTLRLMTCILWAWESLT